MSIISHSKSSVVSKDDDVTIIDERPASKKVLEEDEYLDRMAKIIRRDFFSDLEFPYGVDSTPLSCRSERSDHTYDTSPGLEATPFSTTSSMRSRKGACSLKLNDFLDRYTCEDNDYFEKLQKKDIRRHRAKYPWLYKDKGNHNKCIQQQLKLPSIEEQASIGGNSSSTRMIDWPHNPKNSLFYAPDQDSSKRPQSTINYRSNKYINHSVFKEPLPVSPIPKSRTFRGPSDKIGIDGNLVNGQQSPLISGPCFIASPDTPRVIDEEPQAKSDTNKFYIAKEAPRYELGRRIYQEKVSKVIKTPRRESTSGSSTPQIMTPSFRKNYEDFSFAPERIRTPIRKHR